MRRRRIIGILTLLLASCALLTTIAGWIFFSRWVPTHGKTWLIQELERPGALNVSIGTLNYGPLRGFMLTDVTLTERATGEQWVRCSAIHAGVSWINALVRRQVTFRARITLEHPAATSLTLSGNYPLRERSLSLRVNTEDIPVHSIQPPLNRWLPGPLTDGVLKLKAHIQRSPQGPIAIDGELSGSTLQYSLATGRFKGDVLIDGTAVRSDPASPWQFEAAAKIQQGTIEGLPTVGSITRLEASARAWPDRIEFDRITYEMLGSSWTTEGRVQLTPAPSLETLTSAQLNLTRLSETLPALGSAWQLEGRSDLRMVCRGPLKPVLFLDCLAETKVRDVKVSGERLTTPISGITGQLRYDALTHQLDVQQLQGRIHQHPLAVDGVVQLTRSASVNLHAIGRLPLETFTPWLPPSSPIKAANGLAALDLEITGPLNAARYLGTVQLRQVGLQLSERPDVIDRLDANLSLTNERFSITDGRVRWNDQPMTFVASVVPRRAAPLMQWLNDADIQTSVGLTYGRVQLSGRTTPERVEIETAQLTLAHSDVALRGVVSRLPDRASRLAFSGTLDLADLNTLPFSDLETLKAWELQGAVGLEGEASGVAGRWNDARVDGRLRAERVMLRGVPLEQVTCTIQQRDGTRRIVIPSALIGGGKFWGQLALGIEESTDAFQLQADVVGMQLQQLAQAIPAWQRRSVMGTASAKATVAGKLSDRNSWRGEGWLDASGEHLGDIPLLDRLFQHALLGPLAEWLRWDLLRRAEINRASMRWQLANGRVRTEDLRLGGAVQNVPVVNTAAVALYVNGSVGLDQTLDLTVRPELSEQVMNQSQVLGAASSVIRAAGLLERFLTLARYRVSGTIKEPHARFEYTPQELLKQLLQWSPVDFLGQIFQPPSSGE